MFVKTKIVLQTFCDVPFILSLIVTTELDGD